MKEYQTTIRVLNNGTVNPPSLKLVAQTVQPAEEIYKILTPEMQQQVSTGGIAIGTIVSLTLLIRQIRLLVEACKS